MTEDEMRSFAEYVINTLQKDYDNIKDGRTAITDLILKADKIRVSLGGPKVNLHKRTLLEVLTNSNYNKEIDLPKQPIQ